MYVLWQIDRFFRKIKKALIAGQFPCSQYFVMTKPYGENNNW